MKLFFSLLGKVASLVHPWLVAYICVGELAYRFWPVLWKQNNIGPHLLRVYSFSQKNNTPLFNSVYFIRQVCCSNRIKLQNCKLKLILSTSVGNNNNN